MPISTMRCKCSVFEITALFPMEVDCDVVDSKMSRQRSVTHCRSVRHADESRELSRTQRPDITLQAKSAVCSRHFEFALPLWETGSVLQPFCKKMESDELKRFCLSLPLQSAPVSGLQLPRESSRAATLRRPIRTDKTLKKYTGRERRRKTKKKSGH